MYFVVVFIFAEFFRRDMCHRIVFLINGNFCLPFPTVDEHQRKTFDLYTNFPFYQNVFHPSYNVQKKTFLNSLNC